MDLTTYTAALRDDLGAAAALGDETTRRTAASLGAAVEPAARLTVMAALSDLAAEVTAALGDRVVEVRLDGRDVRVVVTPADAVDTPPAAAPEPAGTPTLEELGGDVSRVTLRMFEQVKARAEQAASAQGVSLNSWLSQTVQGALAQGEPGRGGGGQGLGQVLGRAFGGERGTGGATLRGWVQG